MSAIDWPTLIGGLVAGAASTLTGIKVFKAYAAKRQAKEDARSAANLEAIRARIEYQEAARREREGK